MKNKIVRLDAPITSTQFGVVPTGTMPADRHPALVYLSSLSSGSRRAMRSALNTIAALLTDGQCDYLSMPWFQVRYQHTAACRAALMEHYKPPTVNKHLSALRGVLSACWRLEYISAEDYHRAVDVKSAKSAAVEQAAGRALSTGEFLALVHACQADTSPAGARDGAMLALGYVAGLRRREIAMLQLEHVDTQQYNIHIESSKRNKSRSVPLQDGGARAALEDWLYVRGDGDGALFLRIRRGGHIQPTGISDQAVYDALSARAEQAGIASFTPHDLRRTFAGDLLDTGADIATVQRLMGHASPITTSAYDRRGERVKRVAVGKLNIPWVRMYGGGNGGKAGND